MNNKLTIHLTDKVSCGAQWNWISETSGWAGYHIWCVEAGSAKIQMGEITYTLYKGDVFLFDLKLNHICTHDPYNLLSVSTIYFDGGQLDYRTRIICQKSLYVETAHKIIECMKKGALDAAEKWLESLITGFQEDPGEDVPLSTPVKKICDMIDVRLSGGFTLSEMADYAGYSPNQLIRLFKKELSCTPKQYFLQKKIEYAKSQLVYSSRSIREISDSLGFNDENYFGKIFKRQVGCSPGSYRYRQYNPDKGSDGNKMK